MIKPKPLRAGDKVAIVSPAGAVQLPEIIEQSAQTLTSWGLVPIVAPHALTRQGYYAGNTEERIEDMRMMLTDNSIKAILCSYGGYGCVHLLPHIAEEIANNPKWIIGMSDCSLLLATATVSGVVSMHSRQCRHLAENADDISSEYLRKILFGWNPAYTIGTHHLNRRGRASGMVAGGNLSVLNGLLSTPYDTIKPGRIVFIEDINEPPHKIERMLYTLKLSGVLERLAALIVGQFSMCRENEEFGSTIYNIIRNAVEEYDYPLCFDFPVGHTGDCYPLLVGADAQLEVLDDEVKLKFR